MLIDANIPSRLVTKSCPDRSLVHSLKNRHDCVEFFDKGGYVQTEGWHVVSKAEFSFDVRTLESNALLIYSSSVNERDLLTHGFQATTTWMQSDNRISGFDILALELREGNLICLVNTGSGIVEMRSIKSIIVSDGYLHQIKLQFNQGDITILLNNSIYVTKKADSDT